MVHIPRVLCFVITILIAITAAQLVWSIISPAQIALDQPTEQPKAKLQAPPPPRPDFGAQIARLRLMGKPEILAAPVITEEVPDTSLNLALNGVVALGGGDGFAIIADQTKKHKYYQIDDEVTSGVTLAAVYSEYVLLNRAGRNEKLSLPKAEEIASLPKASTNRRRPTRPAATNRFLPKAPAAPKGDESSSSPDANPQATNTQRSRPTVSGLRSKLSKNPASLQDYFVISPENDPSTGNFKGFRLNPNQASSELFYDLGLAENDIVVSINNVALDNPSKGAQVFQKLINAKELDMTVLRDGTEITLFHSLE